MPSLITFSLINFFIACVEAFSILLPLLSFTPDTSVNNNNLSAFNADAIVPAIVSALILKVSPSSFVPIGDITGIKSFSTRVVINLVFIRIGFPT